MKTKEEINQKPVGAKLKKMVRVKSETKWKERKVGQNRKFMKTKRWRN